MTTLTYLWWFICEDRCVSDVSSIKRRSCACSSNDSAVVAVLLVAGWSRTGWWGRSDCEKVGRVMMAVRVSKIPNLNRQIWGTSRLTSQINATPLLLMRALHVPTILSLKIYIIHRGSLYSSLYVIEYRIQGSTFNQTVKVVSYLYNRCIFSNYYDISLTAGYEDRIMQISPQPPCNRLLARMLQ